MIEALIALGIIAIGLVAESCMTYLMMWVILNRDNKQQKTNTGENT